MKKLIPANAKRLHVSMDKQVIPNRIKATISLARDTLSSVTNRSEGYLVCFDLPENLQVLEFDNSESISKLFQISGMRRRNFSPL